MTKLTSASVKSMTIFFILTFVAVEWSGWSVCPNPPASVELIHDTAKELDPATVAFLDGFSKTFASIATLSIPEQRATIKQMFCVPEHQLEAIEKIEDKEILGRHGSIHVRLFSPNKEALQRAGISVQIKNYPGVIHGFLDLPLADAIKEEAIKDIATWVKTL